MLCKSDRVLMISCNNSSTFNIRVGNDGLEFKWNENSERCLLASYKQNYHTMEQGKHSLFWRHVLKDVRNQLCQAMEECHVKNKIYNLKKRYRKVIDANDQTGETQKTCTCFEVSVSFC